MSIRYFKATVEYDGTDFAGFQWQHDTRTVQGVLEASIRERTGQTVRITGAGRTDAGVHARGQVISFGAETRIPTEKMPLALNTALPADVSVRSVEEVSSDFSARFSASSRVYGYLILNSPVRSALWRRYAGLCRDDLDLQLMQCAASLMQGERDYAAFTNQLQADEPTMRCVSQCRVTKVGRFVAVRIEANAFLRGMVRTIVGTLAQVGAGERSVESVESLFESRDRRMAGPTAAPQGLCLLKVRYGARIRYPRTLPDEIAET